MKKRFYLSGIFLLAVSLAAAAPLLAQVTQGARPVFNHNVRYQYGFEFRYPGPQGWVGMVQVNDPVTGAPYYGGLNADERALYFKQHPARMAGDKFNPNVTVRIYRKSPGADAKEFLNQFVIQRFLGSFINPPADMTLAGRSWITGVTEQMAARDSISVLLRRKFYVLDYKDILLILELATTGDQWAQDEKSFDASVNGMMFESELEQTVEPPAGSPGAAAVLSYTTKDGQTFSHRLTGEMPDMYIVRDETGKEIILLKEDLLKHEVKAG